MITKKGSDKKDNKKYQFFVAIFKLSFISSFCHHFCDIFCFMIFYFVFFISHLLFFLKTYALLLIRDARVFKHNKPKNFKQGTTDKFVFHSVRYT
jgi:hypothetical protein